MDVCILKDHYRECLCSIDRLVERLAISTDLREQGREVMAAEDLSKVRVLPIVGKGSKIPAALGFACLTSQIQ